MLAQLLGITQRIIRVKNDLSNEKFSPRKLFPVTPKTLGDHLIVARYQADLSQAEVAAKLKVSDKTLRDWEYDKSAPDKMQWEALAQILSLDSVLFEAKPNT